MSSNNFKLDAFLNSTVTTSTANCLRGCGPRKRRSSIQTRRHLTPPSAFPAKSVHPRGLPRRGAQNERPQRGTGRTTRITDLLVSPRRFSVALPECAACLPVIKCTCRRRRTRPARGHNMASWVVNMADYLLLYNRRSAAWNRRRRAHRRSSRTGRTTERSGWCSYCVQFGRSSSWEDSVSLIGHKVPPGFDLRTINSNGLKRMHTSQTISRRILTWAGYKPNVLKIKRMHKLHNNMFASH